VQPTASSRYYGWDDLVFNHISARVAGTEHHSWGSDAHGTLLHAEVAGYTLARLGTQKIR